MISIGRLSAGVLAELRAKLANENKRPSRDREVAAAGAITTRPGGLEKRVGCDGEKSAAEVTPPSQIHHASEARQLDKQQLHLQRRQTNLNDEGAPEI